MLLCQNIDATKPAIGSVIWLHGLGASGDDFVPLVPHLDLPDVHFIFPNAPLRPVTINGGYVMPAWYDITTFEMVPEREHPPHIHEAAGFIESCIEKEMERGIQPHQIILVGFSQGAALSLHVGRKYQQALGGIVILSGYMLLEHEYNRHPSHPSNFHTPMLFCHGVRDLVVKYDRGALAYEHLESTHSRMEWRDFYVGHEICVEELRHVCSWLHRRFDIIRSKNQSEEIQSDDGQKAP
jgi:phospholipase/carboxylesterase